MPSRLLVFTLDMFVFGSFAPRLAAVTYTVTVTNDAGAGSLRQAITDANASGGADTIDFNIASGVTIRFSPFGLLSGITDPVTIDATAPTSRAGRRRTCNLQLSTCNLPTPPLAKTRAPLPAPSFP